MSRKRRKSKGPQKFTFRPIGIALDWLDVRISVPGFDRQTSPFVDKPERFDLGAGLVAIRQPGRTRIFNRLDVIKDRRTDRVLGVMRSGPHNTDISRGDWIGFKAENSTLYDDTWKHTLRRLAGLGWQYRATSRLDLAADGRSFLEPFDLAAKGRISYGGRADFVCRYSDGKLKAVELGTRNGNKFGRIYKKSKELELSGKRYIADYWRKLGETDVSNIDRCEIQTKGRELRRYHKGEREPDFWEHLMAPGFRASLFDSMAATFVRFRTGRSGEDCRKRPDLLSWDWSGIVDDGPERWPREKRIEDLGLNSLKQYIRMSYLVSVATGSRRYALAAQEMAGAANLGPWMATKTEAWKREAGKLSASGMRAGTLFDLLQGIED